MTDIVIGQQAQKATLLWTVGDALRFSVRIVDPDPDSPDPENPVMIPRVLTGYSAAAQIRKSTKKTDPIIAAFEFEIEEAEGVIHAYLSPDESTKLDGVASGKWDYQLTDPSGDPLTIMAGPAKPGGQVTR